MRSNLLKIVKFLIGWPLSLLALVFLWRIFTPQLHDIGVHLFHANFFTLFLALCAFQCYFLFRVLLWRKILKAKGHEVPLRDTAWYWSIAEINRYIPGNIWSVVGRGATFGKYGIKQSTLLFAWGQESMLILLGSVTLGLFGLGHIFASLLPSFPLKNEVYWVSIVATLLVGFLWIFQGKLKKHSFIPKKFHLIFTDSKDAFEQFVFSCIAFVFFGLGTYLSITALFSLPLQEITMLIGLFSLSFTIGYLSVITPMGLGVREFVISGSLLSFLAKSIVGFVAIFARFFLVIAELVFLLLSYVMYRLHISLFPKVKEHIKKYKYEYLVGLSIVIYIAYFTTASFYRYTNFFAGRFDLGNMDQTVWNTIHGKIFQLTDPNGTNIMSRLGTHADFILILLAPFYVFWGDPRMLLLIQSIVLGAGALFLYLLAKDLLKSKQFAFVLSLTYLLNPSVQYTNLYDFHAVTLATTLFLGAWYFLRKKQYIWAILFLLLAGLTKEETWIAVGFFGLYFFFFEKKKILGGMLSIFSFVTFYLLIWKFIPAARGGQHFALSYYSDYGSTPTSVIKNIILSPMKLIDTIFSRGRLLYLTELLLPVGFIAFVVPQFLIFALPDLGINLLSNNVQFQQITYQYTAVITPFLFIATMYGVMFLRKKFSSISVTFFSFLILSCTFVSAYLYGPLPGAAHPTIDMFVRQESDRYIIENFLQDIPASFSVAATNNIGSHLSHRQKIYTIPVGIDKADMVVFLLNDAFAQPSLAAQKKMAENMKHDKNYIEVFRENDFVVFEKRNLYTKEEPTLQKGKLYPAGIETLEHRDFEGGKIVIQKTLQVTNDFTTVLFSYPSDGLMLYGRADIPTDKDAQEKFPVVIINRGYLTASAFNEETSYENISETFAKNGFLAITPDYRNNGESDKDRSIVGILGYPIDVLNLFASLSTFSQVDTKNVFVWGYSVGGQVTLSTIAAYDKNPNIHNATIRAASVWAPVTDPYTAYTRFHQLFPNQPIPYQRVYAAFGNFAKNPVAWESISPLFYIDDITTPVRVVHGVADTITPYQSSIELYDDLKSLHNNAQIGLYAGVDHNFTGAWQRALATDIQFFKTFLK